MYLLAFLSHLLLEMMDWLLGPLSLLFLTFCLDFFLITLFLKFLFS